MNVAEQQVRRAVASIAGGAVWVDWPIEQVQEVLRAFRTAQAYAIWRHHGSWLATHGDALGPGVRARCQWAASIGDVAGRQAGGEIERYREQFRQTLGDRALVLPSASSVAPPLRRGPALDNVRRTTMLLTCIASAAGLPVVNIPVTSASGLPVGASLVGPARSDRALIALATEIAGAHTAR
jgi:Asp-tRNA(Asn)/Glu-tRNA(Gln) amidotransferase A subunit family amidase